MTRETSSAGTRRCKAKSFNTPRLEIRAHHFDHPTASTIRLSTDPLQPGLRQGRDAFFHALTPDELTVLEGLLGNRDASHAGDSINVPGQYS